MPQDASDRQNAGSKYRLPGLAAPLSYDNAYKYLNQFPDYVVKYASLINSRFPGLFKHAGYRVNNGKVEQFHKGSTAKGRMPGRTAGIARWQPIGDFTIVKGEAKKDALMPGRAAAREKAAAAKAAKSKNKPKADPVINPDGEIVVTPQPEAPTVDTSGLSGLDPNVGRIIPISLAQGGAKLVDGKVAGQLAGLQFDPVIQELLLEKGKAPRDTAQQLRDVGSWFGQVLGSQATAAKRTAALTDAGVESIEDATGNIVGALGGDANAGAGLVGAAGAGAAGTLRAMGTAQEQYDADIRPLLRAESASAKERVQARGSSRLLDLANRLATARGQRGQAEAAAQFEITKGNNATLDARLDRELGIRQGNNALRQQRFANQKGIEDSLIAASISGAQLEQGASELEARKAAEAYTGKSKFYPYSKAPQTQKDDAYNTIIEAVGRRPELTRQQKLVLARNILNASYGWSLKNPAVLNLALTALEDAEG